MHDHLGQIGYRMEELMAHLLGNLVALAQSSDADRRRCRPRRECRWPIQRMRSRRSSLHLRLLATTVSASSQILRLDGVHQPVPHGDRGIFGDKEDGDADQQADDRIHERVTEPGASGGQQHGQRRQPIGARVHAIGHQGRRTNLAAFADLEPGHGLVAQKADDGGYGDPAEVRQRRGMEQLLNGLLEDQRRR